LPRQPKVGTATPNLQHIPPAFKQRAAVACHMLRQHMSAPPPGRDGVTPCQLAQQAAEFDAGYDCAAGAEPQRESDVQLWRLGRQVAVFSTLQVRPSCCSGV
jgi:hypothetical protein